jgi:hypothetical protein
MYMCKLNMLNIVQVHFRIISLLNQIPLFQLKLNTVYLAFTSEGGLQIVGYNKQHSLE